MSTLQRMITDVRELVIDEIDVIGGGTCSESCNGTSSCVHWAVTVDGHTVSYTAQDDTWSDSSSD